VQRDAGVTYPEETSRGYGDSLFPLAFEMANC
jgi:hypothetical protein